MADSDGGSFAEGSVCMPNIGPKGRRMRMRVGVAGFALGAVGAVGMALAGTPRVARLGLVLPFFAGAIGLFQARAQT